MVLDSPSYSILSFVQQRWHSTPYFEVRYFLEIGCLCSKDCLVNIETVWSTDDSEISHVLAFVQAAHTLTKDIPNIIGGTHEARPFLNASNPLSMPMFMMNALSSHFSSFVRY